MKTLEQLFAPYEKRIAALEREIAVLESKLQFGHSVTARRKTGITTFPETKEPAAFEPDPRAAHACTYNQWKKTR